ADGVDRVEHAGLLDEKERALAGVGEAGADADALVLLADADEPRVRRRRQRPQQAFARGDVGNRDDELDPARPDFPYNAFAGETGRRPAVSCASTGLHSTPPPAPARMLAQTQPWDSPDGR